MRAWGGGVSAGVCGPLSAEGSQQHRAALLLMNWQGN